MTAAQASSIPSIDVRTIPPFESHPRVFGMIEGLESDECFMIISDHDPHPLHYQIETKYPGLIVWEYLEQGPTVWRVKIGKEAPSGCDCCCGS
ncbi:DUF2249 domain-containing protein [Chelatococcus asaccharovorans]|uniref:DUF2249 domain-containing protein n=1 Tax=Chelatococcus asaccharovorans TaxID=28210 RepID=UPI00224C6851|nr:DUF2249 domain-containing protein [Chelatococcus asaccharovorans]CAH1662063.1 conserved hypothetical protein [Chelatococcus asaccharovorans]CAH1690592.1 conserved hypothetical protein [Chelatococcus asaccharovorans]